MSAPIKTWQERMVDGGYIAYQGDSMAIANIGITTKIAARDAEISELRAALKQTEDNAEDISAHLSAMTETARKYRALAQKESAAPGYLHAAILALPMPYHPGAPFGSTWDHFEIEAIRNYANSISDLASATLAQPVAVDASQGWISVQDRLPKIKMDADGNYNFVLVKWRRDSRCDNIPDIDVCNTVYLNQNSDLATHWMPLPAAPVAAIDAQDGEAT